MAMKDIMAFRFSRAVPLIFTVQIALVTLSCALSVWVLWNVDTSAELLSAVRSAQGNAIRGSAMSPAASLIETSASPLVELQDSPTFRMSPLLRPLHGTPRNSHTLAIEESPLQSYPRAEHGIEPEPLFRLLKSRPETGSARALEKDRSKSSSPWASADSTILNGIDDDPDFGINFFAVPADAIDPRLLNKDRLQHEEKAEIAIVVPTSPRYTLPVRDREFPQYWRSELACTGTVIYTGKRIPDAVTRKKWNWPESVLSDFNFTAYAATRCDEDPGCDGFTFDKLQTTCIFMREFSGDPCYGGSGIPLSGTYMKSPSALFPLPKMIDVVEDPSEGQTDVAPTNTIPLLNVTWWVLKKCTVSGYDLHKEDPSDGGRYITPIDQVRHLRTSCLVRPDCVAFLYPGGLLKRSIHSSAMLCRNNEVTSIWSRVPIPPADYVVGTIISIAEQIEAASAGTCRLSSAWYPEQQALLNVHEVEKEYLQQQSGQWLNTRAAIRSGPSHAGKVSSGALGHSNDAGTNSNNILLRNLPSIEEVVNHGLRADLTPRDINGMGQLFAPINATTPDIPSPRFHLYVVDTTALTFSNVDLENPALPRSHLASDYWFTAFAWLRMRFSSSPCITFVPAASHVRMEEVSLPQYDRGIPKWHADNKFKTMARQNHKQTLDFTGALRYAASHSPNAHISVWEDDCVACPGTLKTLIWSMLALSKLDPAWGGLKVGNGGSGHVFAADVVTGLIAYLQTRRGSDNVDVSMWRYLQSQGLSEYISRHSRSAHRGLVSSFHLTKGPVWNPVQCGGPLDYYWGFYGDCEWTTVDRKEDVTGVAAASATDPLNKTMLVPIPGMWDVGKRSPAQLLDILAAKEAIAELRPDSAREDAFFDFSSNFRCNMFSPAGNINVDTRPAGMKK